MAWLLKWCRISSIRSITYMHCVGYPSELMAPRCFLSDVRGPGLAAGAAGQIPGEDGGLRADGRRQATWPPLQTPGLSEAVSMFWCMLCVNWFICLYMYIRGETERDIYLLGAQMQVPGTPANPKGPVGGFLAGWFLCVGVYWLCCSILCYVMRWFVCLCVYLLFGSFLILRMFAPCRFPWLCSSLPGVFSCFRIRSWTIRQGHTRLRDTPTPSWFPDFPDVCSLQFRLVLCFPLLVPLLLFGLSNGLPSSFLCFGGSPFCPTKGY